MYELIFFSMGFGFLSCIIAVFYAFCGWKLFTKAREVPWKALIPFYNLYCLTKITRLKGWLALVYLACVFLFPCTGFLGFIGDVVIILFNILLYYALGKAFRKNTLFTIGLIFVPFVFFPILCLDSSRYKY